MDAHQIARTIKLKSGIEWSPDKEFPYRKALGLIGLIESNTDWDCEMVSVNGMPFGKQYVRINGH